MSTVLAWRRLLPIGREWDFLSGGPGLLAPWGRSWKPSPGKPSHGAAERPDHMSARHDLGKQELFLVQEGNQSRPGRYVQLSIDVLEVGLCGVKTDE